MTGADQFYIFLVCVSCGIASGVFYDVIFCLRYFFRSRWVNFATDVFFFLLFTAGYLFISVTFSLPAFRLYMFAGCLFGLFLYAKSVHKIIAFFMERLYNSIKKKFPRKEVRKWEEKKGRLCQRRKRENLPSAQR